MQEDIKINRVTLDSNVLISAIKENEQYSKNCKELLSLVGTSFLLYQPTVIITELGGKDYQRNVKMMILADVER